MILEKTIEKCLIGNIASAKTKNGNEYSYFMAHFSEMENNFLRENSLKVRFEKSKFPEIQTAKLVSLRLSVQSYSIDNKESKVYNLIEVIK